MAFLEWPKFLGHTLAAESEYEKLSGKNIPGKMKGKDNENWDNSTGFVVEGKESRGL